MSTTEINWCVSGRIEDGQLITQSGERIKIRDGEKLGVGLGTVLWRCIPLTDSTGAVTGVSVVEQLSEIAASDCIGRVTQLGKRGDTVLVKVSPSRKITMHSEYKLAISGLYKLSFEYREGGLYVVAAERLDEVEKVAQTKIQPEPEPQAQSVTKTALSIEESWQQKLSSQIYREFPNFLLSEQRNRNGVLEWEGVVGDSQIRIQGIVGSTALSGAMRFC